MTQRTFVAAHHQESLMPLCEMYGVRSGPPFSHLKGLRSRSLPRPPRRPHGRDRDFFPDPHVSALWKVRCGSFTSRKRLF
jgi:hypothetical protein